MSDDERSQGSSPYTSEADEDDLEEYADAEVEVEPDEVEAQVEGDAEGEADPADEEEDDDEDESDEESEEEEDDDDQDDAEGDDDEDEAGDLEAALGNMEAMDEDGPQDADAQKPLPEPIIPDVKPETLAQQRRRLFVTNPPYPRSYTVDPICALPHPVATHTLAASLCMSYLLTGSDDGFIRCYDFFASVNGKTYLTAPQRHHCGIGEGTMKAGVLKMWWENWAPNPSPEKGETDSKILSPVHSMAMQSDALWSLSGTALGQINLSTVRHDPGKIHYTFSAHPKSPVSCLTLQPDEQGVLSAGEDGEAKQWDLNTGQMLRMFGTQRHSGGAQVVSLGLRPLTPQITNGAPHLALFSTGDDAAGVLPPNNPDDGGGSESSDNSLFGDDSDDEAQRKPKRKASGLAGANGTGALSQDVVMTAYMDGQVLLWDRRAPAQTKPLRLEMGEKTPPWCVSACWSANGNEIFAGRRNGTIDVWDVRQTGSKASGPRLLKSLRNPPSSGPVTCVVGFPDGKHLVCASQDNIRLWKVSEETLPDHRRTAPFKIIAGHHGGVISQILVDASSRFLITASGNRGWYWLGESTKTVLIHDITPNL